MNKSSFLSIIVVIFLVGIWTSSGSMGFVNEQALEQVTEEVEQQGLGYAMYSDPQSNYTLHYPSDWQVEYKKPDTQFDQPSSWFKLPDAVSIVSIELSSSDLTREEFEDGFLKYYPLILRERFGLGPGLKIENKTFGLYEIDRSPAGSIVFTTPLDNTLGANKGMFVSSVLDDNQTISITYISSSENFNKNLNNVTSMIESIRITPL
ncbi:MAG: hypothetical protein WBX01_05700 [Nitrososphaeraceae archaeon]|jgi:hypothetical protein